MSQGPPYGPDASVGKRGSLAGVPPGETTGRKFGEPSGVFVALSV